MSHTTNYPRVLSATSVVNDTVKNLQGEDLGKVHELMIDMNNGRVAYAVLSFGGFLGMGEKLFAIPFGALQLDADRHCFTLDVTKERLERAEGFDKDNWPDFANESFHTNTYTHWNQRAYWND